jgi:hypothetical protein
LPLSKVDTAFISPIVPIEIRSSWSRGVGVIFLDYMRHEPEIVLDKLIAGALVAGAQSFETAALLVGRERTRKGTGICDVKYQIYKICGREAGKGKYHHSASGAARRLLPEVAQRKSAAP